MLYFAEMQAGDPENRRYAVQLDRDGGNASSLETDLSFDYLSGYVDAAIACSEGKIALRNGLPNKTIKEIAESEVHQGTPIPIDPATIEELIERLPNLFDHKASLA